MRIAVVGLGEAGRSIHLPALARLPDARVVAAVDPDPERRAASERAFGVPTGASLDDALSAAPEVVVVGTPPHTHRDLCVRSLDAGCHVICEKPFVTSLAEARELVAHAAGVGRGLALNHEFKELPTFRALRDAARREPPVFVQLWQQMYRPPWDEAGWRGRLVHRSLFEAGIHMVDLAVALFGELPRAVSATTSAGGVPNRRADAVVAATLEFSGGRLAQLVQTRLSRGAQRYFEVRVDTAAATYRASHGGRARLSVGFHHGTRPHLRPEFGLSGLAWREDGRRRRTLARNPRSPLVAATADLFERTLEAFRTGGAAPTPGETGRDLTAVIAACYRSAERGTRVELTPAVLNDLADLRMGVPE